MLASRPELTVLPRGFVVRRFVEYTRTPISFPRPSRSAGMKLLFGGGRKKHQEVVRFNVTVEILSIEGLPAKYTHYRVQLQRGRKIITSGDLHADDEGRMLRQTDAATMQFTSSMQRAASGIEFEEKDYKLNLLRVNPRSTRSPTKVGTQMWLNVAADQVATCCAVC